MTVETIPRPPGGKIMLTYEDYACLPDDGKTYEILEAFELEGETYRLATVLAGNASFEPCLFPGLMIDLAEVWE